VLSKYIGRVTIGYRFSGNYIRCFSYTYLGCLSYWSARSVHDDVKTLRCQKLAVFLSDLFKPTDVGRNFPNLCEDD